MKMIDTTEYLSVFSVCFLLYTSCVHGVFFFLFNEILTYQKKSIYASKRCCETRGVMEFTTEKLIPTD
jgi:hypothetical protein